MYVAATRARRHLTILYPGRFYVRGEGEMIGRPSRFLADAPAELVEAGRPGIGAWSPAVSSRPAAAKVKAGPSAMERFATGQRVIHDEHGPGRVMGFKGGDQVLVQFDRFGLKTVYTRFGGLRQA